MSAGVGLQVDGKCADTPLHALGEIVSAAYSGHYRNEDSVGTLC